MRTLVLLVSLFGSLLAALPAPAAPISVSLANLTLSLDQSSYEVGDTITFQMTGDPHGVLAQYAYGQVQWESRYAIVLEVEQTPLAPGFALEPLTTGVDPQISWYEDILNGEILLDNTDIAYATVLAQRAQSALIVNEINTSTLTLLATEPGYLAFWFQTVDVTVWSEEYGDYVYERSEPTLVFPDYPFWNGPGIQVWITPEPNTAALVALGLVAMAARRRRARSGASA